MIRKVTVVSMIAALILAVTGCNPNQLPQNWQGSISADPGKVAFQSLDGKGEVVFNQETKSSNLPENYPANLVPVIEGSSITAAGWIQKKDGNRGFWVQLLYTQGVTQASEFYRSVMSNAGSLKETKIGEGTVFSGIKENNNITIAITPGKINGSIIQITIEPE